MPCVVWTLDIKRMGIGAPDSHRSAPIPMDNLTYFRRQNRKLAIINALQWAAVVLIGAGFIWLWVR